MNNMKCMRSILFCLVAATVPSTGIADDSVSLLALIEGKALLFVDGKREVLSVGQISQSGVELVSVGKHQATVNRDGLQQVLLIGEVAYFPGKLATPLLGDVVERHQPVTLWASPDGFFYANGTINGVAIRFLIDTGQQQ